jgi:hypothetical protein
VLVNVFPLKLKKEKEMFMASASKKNSRVAILNILPLFFMASLLILPVSAFAEEEGYGPGQDKWKFAIGGYFPSIDTTIKIDGTEVGDNLDLEGLGLSDDDSLWRLDGYWRFAQKHRLAFGYYGFERDGSIGISEQIKIGDIVIPVNAFVSTELNLDYYTIQYTYSYFQGEKWELSAGLGAYWIDLEFSIGASADINGTPIGGGPVFESTDFNGPLPFLALGFEYYITEKWLAIINGGYFQLEVGDVDGKMATLAAKLEYQFTKRWGIGAGYSGFHIDVDIEDGNLRSNIEYTYHGVQLYGILRF